jgi:hypothetical protein
MRPTRDATVLDNVLLKSRQYTPGIDGLQTATLVTCSSTTITFRIPAFSSVAGYSAPLPPGWPNDLAAGTSLLVAFVRNAFTGATDIWALAYR